MNKEKLLKIEQLRNCNSEEALINLLSFIEDDELSIKLIAIEQLAYFNQYSLAEKELIKLTRHYDNEVRRTVIESLVNYNSNDVINAIIVLLEDSDELVRITAAESLGLLKSSKSIPSLVKSLSDKSELVRSYAAASLGEIGDKNIIYTLKEKLKQEKRNAARLGYYYGLYLLGEKEYLNNIIKLLKTKSYKVRSSSVNSLVNMVNKENVLLIKNELNKALITEQTIAVKSSIQAALSEIEGLA